MVQVVEMDEVTERVSVSLFPGSRLFVGNYENGIIAVGDKEHEAIAQHAQTSGKLAEKCRHVAPRALHYMGPDDAAVLYQQPSPEFTHYIHDLYGFTPLTYAPVRSTTDSDRPLSLLEDLLEDDLLIERLRVDSVGCDWRIVPFMTHPLVYELGRRMELPVDGMDEHLVLAGTAAQLNDKSVFQRTCGTLGIPTPQSIHVRGMDQVVAAAKSMMKSNGAAMLRQSRGAGGLGNCEVSFGALERARCNTVEQYLEQALVPRKNWDSQTVLVEPLLELKWTPTTLMSIQNGIGRLDAHIERFAENYASVASISPSSVPEQILERIIAYSYSYGSHISKKGGCGPFDIDWGVTTDGKIIAFESNYRYTGTHHGLAVQRKLCPANGVLTWSSDSLACSDALTFGDLRASLERASVQWDPARGDGVVITIPPAHGSMGFVALATSRKRLDALTGAMISLASPTGLHP